MLLVSGDVNPYKTRNIVEPTPLIIAEESSMEQEIPREVPVEKKTIKIPGQVLTVKTNTDKVVLSRGGSGLKKSTGREQINAYVVEICEKYNMEPELIMSVIVSESDYNPRATTGQCLGLMQISSRWHKDRAAKLGVKDFYDPYGNILLGVDYLSELRDKYKDMRLVLMMYNMSHNAAMEMYKNGQISNYAKKILARAEQYKKGE
jgi:hypothetical protein